MTLPWRCPSCGCLAIAWPRAHARTCVYGVTPPQEVTYAAAHEDGGQ